MEIKNKTVVITGGSSGLGEAVAVTFNAKKAKVVIADINEEEGQKIVNKLGDRALFCKTDITSTEDVQATMDAAMEKFGHIDILVNCAGIFPISKIVEKNGLHDLKLFKRTFDINVIGNFDTMRLAAEKMMMNTPNEEGEKGVIINTSSMAAFDGPMGQIAYASSKAAIAGMTLPAARDLGRYGIRVCTISPGLFETPILAKVPDNYLADMIKTIPFPARLGKPEEYALMAQFIVENPMLNGESIRLDGGYRMPK